MYARRRIYETVADFPKPVIAAVHGFCIGGGSELALACDVRVADRTARFSQAEMRIGLIPGGGGTQRLARLVGRGQAMLISCTGDFVEAEEAHRIGLVEVLVDEGRHLEKALELAGRMARWSPVALRLAKQAVNAAFEMPLRAGLAYEKELFLAAFAKRGRTRGRARVRGEAQAGLQGEMNAERPPPERYGRDQRCRLRVTIPGVRRHCSGSAVLRRKSEP